VGGASAGANGPLTGDLVDAGCHLGNDDFSGFIGSRLAIAALQFRRGATCAHCHLELDKTLAHAHVCAAARGRRNERHTALKVVGYATRPADYVCANEPFPSSFYPPQDGVTADQVAGKRADLGYSSISNPAENPTLVDFTITAYTVAAGAPASQFHTKAGDAATKAEENKTRDYAAAFKIPAGKFFPVAFETTGAPGKHARAFMRWVAGISSEPPETSAAALRDAAALRRVSDRFSVALWRQLARGLREFAAHSVRHVQLAAAAAPAAAPAAGAVVAQPQPAAAAAAVAVLAAALGEEEAEV
jgi:hypothetical protein